MLVSHILLLGVIVGLAVLNPKPDCNSKPTYSSLAVENWPGMSLKEQTLELFTLKNEIFHGDSKLQLSPQLYKFGAKWDSERNKTRFGKQPKPKSDARWVIVRPDASVPGCFDGTVINLPLDRSKTSYIMSVLTEEQKTFMTDKYVPCE